MGGTVSTPGEGEYCVGREPQTAQCFSKVSEDNPAGPVSPAVVPENEVAVCVYIQFCYDDG